MSKAQQTYQLLSTFDITYSNALQFLNQNKKLFNLEIDLNFETRERTFIFDDKSSIIFNSNDITYKTGE